MATNHSKESEYRIRLKNRVIAVLLILLVTTLFIDYLYPHEQKQGVQAVKIITLQEVEGKDHGNCYT